MIWRLCVWASLIGHMRQQVNHIRVLHYPLLLGLHPGGITCGGRFAAEHSLQVAVLPCLRRFICDFVNAVSPGVFPHIAQTFIAAESGPTGVPLVAGGLWHCVNANMIGNDLRYRTSEKTPSVNSAFKPFVTSETTYTGCVCTRTKCVPLILPKAEQRTHLVWGF